MENASLSSGVWNNSTTSSLEDDDALQQYLFHIPDLALEVLYIIMGTVGVLDNLFVIITFALFIKIAEKVFRVVVPVLARCFSSCVFFVRYD